MGVNFSASILTSQSPWVMLMAESFCFFTLSCCNCRLEAAENLLLFVFLKVRDRLSLVMSAVLSSNPIW